MIADSVLDEIRGESRARYGALNLPGEWIAPNYGGRSIANVPATIVRAFGGEISTAPLQPAIAGHLLSGVRRVVFVVADALGYSKLLAVLERNPQNGFGALLRGGATLVPITSVFPSTTTSALTTLWSGYMPAEHGFLGYQLFLREFGVRAEMLAFSPSATVPFGRDQLIAAGLDPDKFLSSPSLAQMLGIYGVSSYHLLLGPYVKSGLSRVQMRGAKEIRGVVTSSDLWVVLREMLEAKKDERALFAAYWGGVDGVGHLYGASSPTVAAEVNNLAYSFEREFLAPLSPAARAGTLFLLTADHGQMDTPRERTVALRDHPELRDRLVMDFTGEPRAAYLYCRAGEMEAARTYIETQMGGRFVVLDSQAALQQGLFGTGTPAPEARFRIGDLLVMPRENYTLVESKESRTLLGRHGGLTPEEMLVPLIAARLDG